MPADYRDLILVDPNTGFNAMPSTTDGPTAITTSQYWQISHCQTVFCPVPETCFALSNGASWIELGVATSKVLRSDELQGLKHMYAILYGDTFTAHFADCSNSVNFGGVTLKKGQMISAHWPPNNPVPERCGTIHGFFVHEICLSSEVPLQHIVAEVHWYETLPLNRIITPLIAATLLMSDSASFCQYSG